MCGWQEGYRVLEEGKHQSIYHLLRRNPTRTSLLTKQLMFLAPPSYKVKNRE
jgi:hypothetical protein